MVRYEKSLDAVCHFGLHRQEVLATFGTHDGPVVLVGSVDSPTTTGASFRRHGVYPGETVVRLP